MTVWRAFRFVVLFVSALLAFFGAAFLLVLMWGQLWTVRPIQVSVLAYLMAVFVYVVFELAERDS